MDDLEKLRQPGGEGVATLTAELAVDSAIRSLLLENAPTQLDLACARAADFCMTIDARRRPRAALRARLLQAACLATAGRTDEAKDVLVRAAATCAEVGLPRLILDEGPQVGSLIPLLYEDQRAARWKAGWPSIPRSFLADLMSRQA
jgi:hypothetical protein